MSEFKHEHFQCSFENWIAQQHQDLDELLAARSSSTSNSDDRGDEKMETLIEKAIKHFEEYYERRTLMAKDHAPLFLCPSWCTPFENAFMWIGGCRPSLAVRLVYSVCASEMDEHLCEFLKGERKGNLAEISAKQMDMINTLHHNTIKEEEKMSSKMASLQEEIADEPLAIIAKSAGKVGETSQGVDEAMEAHSLSLASILAEADRLRLSTFKVLMAILTPFQAVDLLVSTKKLHLSVHEWGKRWNHRFERPSCSRN